MTALKFKIDLTETCYKTEVIIRFAFLYFIQKKSQPDFHI